MLEQAFEVAVIISAIDRFTAPARLMAQQMGLLGQQSEALQKKLAGLKNMAFVGGAMTLAGAVMAKGLVGAADAAGNLETSLMGVKAALKLNNDEYQKTINLAQNVGIPTIFSAQDVGGIMQAMGTAGLNKQQVLDPNILKEYVNFADVQAQIKKENAPDVVSAAVKMAHQYQLYSSEEIKPFLNELNGALLHTNGTASEFATTFKYISQQAKIQGMSAQDTLDVTAWLDRMGLGNGRGGTNFADFLKRSIYHSSGKKADAAMVAAGFVKDGHSVFEDAKGNFVGIPKAVQIMQDFAKRFGNNANLMSPLLQSIFGTQGARVAQLMTTGGAADQYTNVRQQIAGTETVNQTQEGLNNTWQGKVKQLKTTLEDIKTTFGFSVRAALMPLLSGLDDILARVLKFAQAHPTIMKFVAGFATLATAALLVVGPIMLLAGVLGYLASSGMIAAGFSLIGSALATVLPIILGFVAVGFLLYKAWQTDFGGIREKAAAVFNWLKTEVPIVVAKFVQYWDMAKTRAAAIWTGIVAVVTKVWKTVGPVITAAAKSIWGTVRSAFTQVATFIRAIWPPLWKIVSFAVVSYLAGAWVVIKTVANLIWATLKYVWILISTDVKVAWTLIKDTIQVVWDLISGIITIGLKLLTGDWSGAWEAVKNTAASLWKDIRTLFVDFWNGLGQLFSTGITATVQWGKDIVNGIWEGIKGMGSWIWDRLTEWVKEFVPGPIKKALGINSPSKVMMEFGKYTAQGLALGMTGNANLVKLAAKHLSTQAAPSIGIGTVSGLSAEQPGAGMVYIAPGAIVVNAAPGQSPEDIAAAVLKKLGRKIRNQSYGRPSRVVSVW